jgi:hypothetical protein
VHSDAKHFTNQETLKLSPSYIKWINDDSNTDPLEHQAAAVETISAGQQSELLDKLWSEELT